MGRIDELLLKLTLEEKVSLLAGADMWTTVPIERLGIPALKVSDGPNGARGGGFAGGVTSACFPVGTALASTWNTALVERVGQALGQEARTKGARVLLAPTVNIHRSPLGGRNFECYSEDPYLSARMAVAYIKGLQSQGVGATVKHFCCNDSEFERMSISSEVGERALREVYLPPFKAAVQEADTWAVMTAYNKINGTFASENPYTISDILRGEWGFEGLVMSDWYGTKSTGPSVNAGQDLEMPGPTQWRGDQLVQAVRAGEVSEEAIDARARQVLALLERAGCFEDPKIPEERAVDLPEHRALIRRAGAEGVVLLKNERNVLPLDLDHLKSLAIIGPNAKAARIMGGGSARVNAHHAVSPYEGIVERAGAAVELGYEIGCTNHKLLPLLNLDWLAVEGEEGDHGLHVDFFKGLELQGDPVWSTTTYGAETAWMGQFSPHVDPRSFSARLSATLTVPEDGPYTFGVSSAGLTRLYLDGEMLIDNWSEQSPGETFFGSGSAEKRQSIALQAGREYELALEYSQQGGMLLAGVRLGCLRPIPEDAVERSAALAARSDAALVFVGLSDEWDSEGRDRPDMELVGQQNALVEAVAAANPNTVVVLQTGSVVNMPWLDQVAALLEAWYPGQECGEAIADVLFGEVSPAGRLPLTWPQRLEDTPAYINYPGENGKVLYGEGIFVGYRYYERKKLLPLFPFGYGLSYSRFQYGDVRLSAADIEADEKLKVSVDVTNVGERAAQEVVQLYVCDVASSLVRPEKELKGFAKVMLAAGETRTVDLSLGKDELAYYDDLKQCWVAEAGEFQVLLGASSQDIHARATFSLRETAAFGGPPRKGIRLSLDSTLAQLLASEEASAMLGRHLPGMEGSPQLGMAMGFSLRQLGRMAPDMLPEDKLEAIADELAELSPLDESELPEAPRLSLWQRLLVKLASLHK